MLGYREVSLYCFLYFCMFEILEVEFLKRRNEGLTIDEDSDISRS